MVLPPIAFALYAFATCLALTSADETPVGSLYAYGANISGLPLFYGDGQYLHQTTTTNPFPASTDTIPGMAYLGNGHPESISTAANLTCSSAQLPSPPDRTSKLTQSTVHIDNTAKTLISTPNNTALASNWTTPLLYINTQTGSFDSAGFVSDSNTTYTTAGFVFWGRILLFTGESVDGSVGRSFWAEPYGEEKGFWRLLWNSDNAASDSAVPVVLKRQPPPEIDGR